MHPIFRKTLEKTYDVIRPNKTKRPFIQAFLGISDPSVGMPTVFRYLIAMTQLVTRIPFKIAEAFFRLFEESFKHLRKKSTSPMKYVWSFFENFFGIIASFIRYTFSLKILQAQDECSDPKSRSGKLLGYYGGYILGSALSMVGFVSLMLGTLHIGSLIAGLPAFLNYLFFIPITQLSGNYIAEHTQSNRLNYIKSMPCEKPELLTNNELSAYKTCLERKPLEAKEQQIAEVELRRYEELIHPSFEYLNCSIHLAEIEEQPITVIQGEHHHLYGKKAYLQSIQLQLDLPDPHTRTPIKNIPEACFYPGYPTQYRSETSNETFSLNVAKFLEKVRTHLKQNSPQPEEKFISTHAVLPFHPQPLSPPIQPQLLSESKPLLADEKAERREKMAAAAEKRLRAQITETLGPSRLII